MQQQLSAAQHYDVILAKSKPKTAGSAKMPEITRVPSTGCHVPISISETSLYNLDLDASVEELRVFGAPIVSIRACTTIQLPQTSAYRDRCDLPSMSQFLLIGLRNGTVIVRDLQTTQFIRTVKAHADPVLQMTLCPPVDATKDIHLYALSSSYSVEQENHIGLLRMLKLTPEQTCFSK
ncbi:hypothetical protein AHF37_09252 [Paragonimus kellicotti]|nr:hypothetical protein AHF37_09252 [Paragonimus kellicotti]